MVRQIGVLFFGLIFVGKISAATVWKANDGIEINKDFRLDVPHIYMRRAQLVLQCYKYCAVTKTCKSVNFNPSTKKCALLRDDPLTAPTKLVPDQGYENVRIGAFYKEVTEGAPVDPCTQNPCLHGTCLTINEAVSGGLSYKCVCFTGFTGKDCNVPGGDANWSEWSDWSACSVTCATGYQERRRQCIQADSQQERPEDECGGSGIEARPCPNPKECPKWSQWSDWNSVDRIDSWCGPYSSQRTRTCLHGGSQNVDLGCMGKAIDQKYDKDPSCNAPIKLIRQGSDGIGEGSLQVYNDLTDSWGAVCSDNFNQNAATVACKQLGFVSSAQYTSVSHSGTFGATARCASDDIPTLAQCETEWPGTCPSDNDAHIKCVVNGAWSNWKEWGSCSVECAVGLETRVRTCSSPSPANGGTACDQSEAAETRQCTKGPCPVDGHWADWPTDWGQCNETCNGGYQNKTRACVPPKYGGKSCVGDSFKEQQCNTESCPVDGYWNPWGQWSTCTEECGGGGRTRSRVCHQPQHGGVACGGAKDENSQCNTQECPVNAVMGVWVAWSPCTVTCGGGTKTRTRTCVEAMHGGQTCEQTGPVSETEPCNDDISCAVDGKWRLWTLWSECSLTCGDETRSRSRDCIPPRNGGVWCSGVPDGSKEVQTEDCGHLKCPIHCDWAPWSEWGTCSKTCGDGETAKTRVRAVLPQYGGNPCEGNAKETTVCNERGCPVDCAVSDWGGWFTCTLTCGGGTQSRQRTVTKQPAHGGVSCPHLSDEKDCENDPCPVDCQVNPWGQWGSCPVTCGSGNQLRSRTVRSQSAFGGKQCPSLNDDRLCATNPCPMNCMVSAWSAWSSCDKTCGPGTKSSTRTVTSQSANGGEECPFLSKTESCYDADCPGSWNAWNAWTSCSKTCGTGTRTHNRDCDRAKSPFLAPCVGDASEQGNCNSFDCSIIPASCLEAVTDPSMGLANSDYIGIKPAGAVNVMEVYCDTATKQSILSINDGATDRQTTHVNGYEGAGSWVKELSYNSRVNSPYRALTNQGYDLNDVKKLVDASGNCQQFMNWTCHAALINNKVIGSASTYWTDWEFEKQTTWGHDGVKGTKTGIGDTAKIEVTCPCSQSNSCADPIQKCNCDKNDEVLRSDFGFVADKSKLPVSGVYAGDTGGSEEYGFMTAGPLVCW